MHLSLRLCAPREHRWWARVTLSCFSDEEWHPGNSPVGLSSVHWIIPWPHCQQFLLEHFFSKVIFLLNHVDSAICVLSNINGTVQLERHTLLFNLLNLFLMPWAVWLFLQCIVIQLFLQHGLNLMLLAPWRHNVRCWVCGTSGETSVAMAFESMTSAVRGDITRPSVWMLQSSSFKLSSRFFLPSDPYADAIYQGAENWRCPMWIITQPATERHTATLSLDIVHETMGMLVSNCLCNQETHPVWTNVTAWNSSMHNDADKAYFSAPDGCSLILFALPIIKLQIQPHCSPLTDLYRHWVSSGARCFK